jgi:hypothetical protein
LKKTFTKKDWWSGSRCRPIVQAQYHKENKNENKNNLIAKK